MSAEWASFHIFYGGQTDALITGAIHPVVKDLLDNGDINAYFFIRYWNGGPHVRLRLRVNPATTNERLIEAIAPIQNYVHEYPGESLGEENYHDLSKFMVDFRDQFIGDRTQAALHLETPEPLQPSNTLQRRPYRFDAQRYGGSSLRGSIEDHFFYASEQAFDILNRTPGAMGKRRALALRMMAAGAVSLRLSPGEAAAMFRDYFSAAHKILPEDRAGLIERQGSELFAREQEDLRRVINSLYKDEFTSPDGQDYAGVLLDSWGRHLKTVLAEIARVERRKELTNSAQNILMDFLHMFNNRLGTPVIEELFMSYLLARGFEVLKED